MAKEKKAVDSMAKDEIDLGEKKGAEQPGHDRKEISITRDRLLGSFDVERGRYEAVSRRIGMLQSAQFEILSVMEAIDEIGKAGKGHKVVVPLGAGIMMEASLDNTKKVMFSYAGGTVTHKAIPDVKEELKRRLELLKNENRQASVEREKIGKGLENLRNIITLADNNARKQTAASKGQGNV